MTENTYLSQLSNIDIEIIRIYLLMDLLQQTCHFDGSGSRKISNESSQCTSLKTWVKTVQSIKSNCHINGMHNLLSKNFSLT